MTYTTWLRWGVIAGIFIVPFVLLVSPAPGFQILGNMFFPYITGKNFTFRILVEFMLVLYAILALKEPKYRPTGSLLMWASVLFVAWMAVANGLSVDPVKSFWSNFERMEGYVGLFHLFVWFVVSGAVLTADNLWDRFFNTSIGVSMFTGILALMQMLHIAGMSPSSQSGARADTTFGNAAYLGVYMLVMLFITLYMLVRRRQSAVWQVVYGLALVLQAVGLYATETRGAILGAVGGIVVAAIWLAWQGRGLQWQGLRRVAIGGLVVVVVIVGAFFALKNTSFVQNSSTLSRFASISLTDRTTASRFQIWHMAWRGFLERPVQGWGQENFDLVFNKYYEPTMWDQEQWFDRAHNQFVDWFINGGAPAGLLYIALYALAVWAIIRTDKLSVAEQAVLLGLFAGVAFNNLFVFDNLVAGIYFWGLLAFVHGLVRRPVPGRLWLTKPMSDHALAVAAPVIGIVILGAGWWLNVPGIVRAQTLVDAVNPSQAPAQALADFEAAAGDEGWPAGNQMGKQEVAEQLGQYASALAGSSQSPDLVTQVETLANAALGNILAQRPHDARIELFYATFLASAGQRQPALDELKAALADSPTKQQILFQLGITSINAGDPTGALSYLKQAYDEAPAYPTARILYASGYYYTGNIAAGDALIVAGFGTTIVDNDQLLQVYNDTKQYARAESIWQLRISNDPKNVNNYIGLAQAYFTAGNTAATIATLQQIIKIDPSQATQVNQLITQIQNGTLKPPGK